MKFVDFFATDFSSTQKSKYVFVADGPYPLISVSFFLRVLKGRGTTWQILDIMQQQPATIKAHLETSFLGQKNFYWLKDFSVLDAKKRKIWLDYFGTYSGPNVVAYYDNVANDQPTGTQKIVVPAATDLKTFQQFAKLMNLSLSPGRLKAIKKLLSNVRVLEIDMVYIVLNYLRLLGNRTDEFITQWLDQLVVPESSLFTLSEQFLAKRSKEFYTQWATIVHQYSEQFWIAYWSDVVWRAANYVRFCREKNHSEAKKISFRLPFSFINRDWRKVTTKELIHAHDFLTALDYRLKNSGTAAGFEPFFSGFFCNQF